MRIRLAIVFSLGVSTVALYGDEQIVHQRITANAAEAAYAYSCGYVAFINSTSSDLTLIRATNALVIGSFDEDFKASEDLVGGNRSFNHFYDPLDLTFGNGLSDAPPDIRVTIGRNSFTWGSTSNCVGLDFNGVAGIGRNVNTTNIWSWPNARGYELLGLTATNQADRIAALLNMYRAVGQVIHLLQDTSQPQHARNEQHVNPFTNWLAKLDPWASPIEDYGGKHHLELNYQQFMLDWKGAGFTKLEDFWDRHMYQGHASALNAETNGGASTLGLAEWCNGNFLGERHLYPEYYDLGSIKRYPYPSRDSSTDYLEKKSHLAAAVHGFTLKNGEPAQAVYLQKTGDGEHMDFHSRFTYFGAKVPYFGMITINDDNVLSNYHALFIPKAVKYSAGLIDYYFRGKLDVGLSANFFYGDFYLHITNSSSQDLSGGSFRLFYDDASHDRTELTGANFVTNYPGTLAAGGSFDATFIPVTGAVNYILVYQGAIGTTGGSACDPVDDGLAIAAKSFTIDNSAAFSNLAGCYSGSVSSGFTEYFVQSSGTSATCSGTLTLHSTTPYAWTVAFEFAPANNTGAGYFWGPFGTINGSGTLNGGSWTFNGPGGGLGAYTKQFSLTTDASHDQVISWTATAFSGVPPLNAMTPLHAY